MESQQSNKPVVYVCAGTNQEFLQYQQGNLDLDCVMVTDGNVLRGRVAGKVVQIGSYQTRWNYLEIQESVERYQHQWNISEGKSPDDDSEKQIEYAAGF